MMKLPDEFDGAIVGRASRCGFEDVIAYDATKIIEVLTTEDDLTEEDAWDHFYFNIQGSYVGETTPIFIHRIEEVADELE